MRITAPYVDSRFIKCTESPVCVLASAFLRNIHGVIVRKIPREYTFLSYARAVCVHASLSYVRIRESVVEEDTGVI